MSTASPTRPKMILLLEEIVAFAATAMIIFVPFLDKIIQKLIPRTGGIPNSNLFVSFSIIALCFSASILTTKDRKHLNVGLLETYTKGRLKSAIGVFNAFVSVAVNLLFFFSSVAYLLIAIGLQARVGFIPTWLLMAIMPLAYLIMSFYFVRYSGLDKKGMIIASLGFILGLFLSFPVLSEMIGFNGAEIPAFLSTLDGIYHSVYPWFNILWVIVLLVGATSGVPIFVVLGGLAYTLFTKDSISISAIPVDVVAMLRDDNIPALPLFTITGYILAQSGAGKRLIEVFRSLMGWMPGGTVIVAVLACTFFTTFTGASGITILALGGLLAIILTDSGHYSKDFSHGIITSSGAIGVMLPPSLAVIMYGAFASMNNEAIDIMLLFRATFLPGLLMVLGMCAAGVYFAIRKKTPTVKFEFKAAGRALFQAAWELLLPLAILAGYLLGFATIPQLAAFSVVYVILIEVMVKREIPWPKLPGIILKAMSVVGGTLIIIAAAKGLAQYIIYTGVPDMITEWIGSWINSKFLFLVILNILLLVVGCFLDIFSATMVVPPLLFPLAQRFGIQPYHLASIFLLNLSIGFLTPPVGMNLFLASYTFEKPLTRIYRNILPFLLIQFLVLAVVTYVPWFSTALIPAENLTVFMP